MKRILEYRFIIAISKLFGAPEYLWAWYKGALRVAREDYEQANDRKRRTIGICGPFKLLEYDTYYEVLFHDRPHTIIPK